MAQLVLAWDRVSTTRSMYQDGRTLSELLLHVDVMKVGSARITATGPYSHSSQADETRVKAFRAKKPTMWDSKIHEIPSVTGIAVGNLAKKRGVTYCTVHASSGVKSLKAAVDAVRNTALTPLAVTVLTCHDTEECRSIFGNTPEQKVLQFADMFLACGGRGIVCSPRELKILGSRGLVGPSALTTVMTPGIVPDWAQKSDQERTMTPGEAVSSGATHIVVGRPITKDRDPPVAIQRVRMEMREAESLPISA